MARREEFRVDYANRLQEIIDLLYNPEQAGILIDEWLGFIHDPAGPDIAEADAALWNHHPEIHYSGLFYQLPAQLDLEADVSGFAKKMKAYVASRQAFLARLVRTERAQAPSKPAIRYHGGAGYPIDALNFALDSETNKDIQRIAWRIAEVTLPGTPSFDPALPRRYEIEAV